MGTNEGESEKTMHDIFCECECCRIGHDYLDEAGGWVGVCRDCSLRIPDDEDLIETSLTTSIE